MYYPTLFVRVESIGILVYAVSALADWCLSMEVTC